MAKSMEKKYGVKTSEIYMYPQTREEIRKLIEKEQDPVHKSELEGILERVNDNPDQGIWYTYWKVVRRKERGLHVGGFWFMGEPNRGVVEICFTIFKEFRGRRYATQCLREITEWAFANKVYTIEATVATENSSAISVLDRSGYVYRSGDRVEQSYSIEKQRTGWAGFYLILGVTTGLFLGILLNSMIAGMIIGVAIGLLAGTGMDVSAMKEREKVTGEKYVRRKKRKSSK